MHSGKLDLKRGATMTAAVMMATIACLLGLLVGSALAAETPWTGTGTIVIVEGAEANEYQLDVAGNKWPVEFGPAWYKTYTFTAGQEITVTGELDTGRDGTKTPEIDVASFTDANGDQVVRTAGGPPPWAGGTKNHDKVRGNGGTPDNDGTPDADD
jgi:hypothetical protein